jgi:hypothetical protein
LGLALLAWGETSMAGNRRPQLGAGRPLTTNGAKGLSAGPKHPSGGGIATIQYDNDIPFNRDGTLDVPIGNRFDVPPSLGRLYQITFRLAGCFTTPNLGQQISIFDIDPTAMHVQLVRQFTGGGSCMSTAGGVVRTAMLLSPILVGPFVAAIRNTPFASCDGNTALGGTCEGVALSSGLIDPGHGFHAIRVSGSHSTAPNLGNRNAILRASLDVLPVELMSFDLE